MVGCGDGKNGQNGQNVWTVEDERINMSAHALIEYNSASIICCLRYIFRNDAILQLKCRVNNGKFCISISVEMFKTHFLMHSKVKTILWQ